MGVITSSQYAGDENPGNIESIAAAIFSRQGIDFAAVQRAGGWTNAVWMTDKLVLRLSTKKENEDLLHEARLSAFLPSEVGYPQIVEAGATAGFAWTLARRLPGRSLGEVWADLHWKERVTALQGLWARAQAVHSVPCGDIATLVPGRAWFNSTDPEEAEKSLSRLTKEGIFTQTQTFVLQDTLAHFWQVLPNAPCVLCHGDLTMDNAVWHEGQVTALLDFEFAVMAPIQLDLNHLVKCVLGPENNGYSSSPKDIQGTQQILQTVKDIALPLLEQSSSRALLVGYAILLELWLLELWLAHPEGEGPMEHWGPLRRLRLLAAGNDGYLAPLILG
jgi:aminoglycoside phosphotransferase (APT) family kinase protein